MQVIVFHRNHTVRKALQPTPMASTVKVETKEAQTKDSSLLRALLPSDKTSQGEKQKVSAGSSQPGLSRFKYELSQGKDKLILKVEAVYSGQIPVKGSCSLDLEEWSVFRIYFRPTTGKVEVVSSTALNPVSSQSENNSDNYIGRLIVTDSEALLYLRGRIPNISGFKNIVLKDDEDSAVAVRRYSPKVSRFLDELNDRQRKLGELDIFKQIAYLETQVDVLTKIILDNDLVKDKLLAKILRETQHIGLCDSVNPEKIRTRLAYKRKARVADQVC